ncbi:hypothetical protein [Streptomyces sp. NPDC056632]|uniref:hypothetical protein n=1 Tax=Streptomyces sp. NPDC056632 TaxID=3345884 RepID=UPI0036BDC531
MGFTHRDAEYSREGHEGWVVAVLPDGADAPHDTWEEALQAAEKHDLSWAWSLKYDGREGRPRAAGIRATCCCGWKGPKREAKFANRDMSDSFACETGSTTPKSPWRRCCRPTSARPSRPPRTPSQT